MAKDIKAQRLMAAHAAGFFLGFTEDIDDGVFLGALGAILMTRAGGEANKAIDMLVKLGSAMTDGAKKGEL